MGSQEETKPRPRATVEEVADEDEINPLPSLPEGHKYALEEVAPEADTVPDREEDREFPEEKAGEDSESDKEFFDASEEMNEKIDWVYSPCAECKEIEETLHLEGGEDDGPALHVDVDHPRDLARTPGRRRLDGMPDIATHSVVTRHSSHTKVSLMGEADPFGINDEALEGATGIMRMWRMEVEEGAEGDDAVAAPWLRCEPNGSTSART
ncbi:hypothetical protein C8R46DRAFT_1232356 [Mycena filopes]|nr:hypothetical protein C8R46DRAFT_1232356 [Mycena filopes]